MPDGFSIHRVTKRYCGELIDTFLDAFGDGVEYCDYKPKHIESAARATIVDYFAGKRGVPNRSSRLAILDGKPDVVASAALLVKKKYGIKLDLLMVRPPFQRRGLARALCAAALKELHREGVTTLWSAHDAANEPSEAWHRALGFVEEPDLNLAQLRAGFFQHELWRAKEAANNGAVQKKELKRLKQQYDYWRKEAKRLEAIANSEGYEAVSPVSRCY